jgi:hypothetical protein
MAPSYVRRFLRSSVLPPRSRRGHSDATAVLAPERPHRQSHGLRRLSPAPQQHDSARGRWYSARPREVACIRLRQSVSRCRTRRHLLPTYTSCAAPHFSPRLIRCFHDNHSHFGRPKKTLDSERRLRQCCSRLLERRIGSARTLASSASQYATCSFAVCSTPCPGRLHPSSSELPRLSTR